MQDKKVRDFKTEAVVLWRTNFGEADRILTAITPLGKRSVLAKSVRKEKSRLAGAVEPFSLTEMNLHEGRGELLTLTGAKCQKFYSNILKDFTKLEVTSEILKRVAKAAEAVETAEYFELTKQCLEALNRAEDAGAKRGEESVPAVNIETVLAWFYLNLARVGGEEINLHFDADGEKLKEDGCYVWDAMEKVLKKEPAGKISGNEIKMLRLMVSAKLELVLRVRGVKEMMPELLYIAKTVNQL